MTDEQPTLPGLEPVRAGSSAIERAAHRQLTALQARGLLRDDHAIVVALIGELASVVGQSATRGRGSAVAMAAKELREAMALLPTDPGPQDPMVLLDQELQEAERRALASHGKDS